jgi:hypothetical protein
MFGYEPCLTCKLYHLTKDLDAHVCGHCSSKDTRPPSKTPLSKPQYDRLYVQRLNAVKHFLKPTLPSYPSDVFGDNMNTHKEE